MAEMTLREKAVMGGFAVVGLFAVTAVLWFTVFAGSHKAAKTAFARAKTAMARDQRLIGEKADWEEAYFEALGTIPEVAEFNPDASMMETIRKIALAHNITFTGEKSSGMGVADEMNRLTIELDWTGAFETLVGFLHELETTDRGKFDVTAINFSPVSKRPGMLSGKMTVVCIYRKKAT